MSDPVFSFEFYPPPKSGAEIFPGTVEYFAKFPPAFMDITFGAGGESADTNMRTLKTTLKTAQIIRANAPDTPLIVHVPNNRFDKLGVMIAAYMLWHGEDVNLLMPMGGDGPPLFPGQGYRSTENLITGLCEMREKMPGKKILEMTVVVEPEKPDALERLKAKISAVPERTAEIARVVRAVMQYSYNTETILKFLEKTKKEGIDIEIVPGFMPIGNRNRPDQVRPHSTMPDVMVDRFGVIVPAEVSHAYAMIHGKGPEAVRAFAVGIAAPQLHAIKNAGINRAHFFAANRAALTLAIMKDVWPDIITVPQRRVGGPLNLRGAVRRADL